MKALVDCVVFMTGQFR